MVRLSHDQPDHRLVALEAGTFLMGANNGPHPQDGEGPAREVTLDAFNIAAVTATNLAFSRFVQKTKYRIVAEKKGTSFMFKMLVQKEAISIAPTLNAPFWYDVSGAVGISRKDRRAQTSANVLIIPLSIPRFLMLTHIALGRVG